MARTKKRALCRGCGKDYEPKKATQQYCSRGCASKANGHKGAEHGAKGGPPEGKANPAYKHGFYSKLFGPVGQAALARREGLQRDAREELEEQLALTDAMCAQVADLAAAEPAAIPLLAKALATRGEAAQRLASYDLRKRELDTPKAVDVNVNVKTVG